MAGEVWKPNLHAHIVFDWYDHSTGKSIKTTSLDAIEMQTICAEVLGMERGVSSENISKHPRYKAQARQKELEALQKERDEVVAKREETERMTETLREESKTSSLGSRRLEEDIENLSESLHVKAEGIVKGYSTGCLPTGSPESRKRRAKKAEENEAKTKAEASAQIKRLFEINVRRKKNWRRTR